MITLEAGVTRELNVALIPFPIAEITPGFVRYGWEGNDWIKVIDGMEIPYYEAISCAPVWKNTSSRNVIGHVHLLVTYPDGTVATPTVTENQDKELAPSESVGVLCYPFISNQKGIYAITATLSCDDRELDVLTWNFLVPSIPAEFELSNLAISPLSLKVAEDVTITATLTNMGDEAGEAEVVCNFRPQAFTPRTDMTQVISLGAHESSIIEFRATMLEAGTCEVSIDGLSGTFEVEEGEIPIILRWIYGHTTDAATGRVIPLVRAEVLETGSYAQSDGGGLYVIKDIPCPEGQDCTFTVRFSHPDYETKEAVVTVGQWQTGELNVELTASRF